MATVMGLPTVAIPPGANGMDTAEAMVTGTETGTETETDTGTETATETETGTEMETGTVRPEMMTKVSYRSAGTAWS